MKKISIVVGICAIIMGVTGIMSSAWTGPNYWEHYETPLSASGLYHNCEMQIQPSYRDGGYHYAQGYFTFDNGPSGRVTTYTSIGTSPNDNRYLTAFKRYRDYWSFDNSLPKVSLRVNAVKIPVGSSSWPVF